MPDKKTLPRLQTEIDTDDLGAKKLSTEEELRQLQQLYDFAPNGYHSLDQDGKFLRINQTELTMLGYSKEELIGKKKFADLLTPESRKKFQANFSLFKKRGWSHNLEFQIVCKNGALLPVSVSGTAILDQEGNYLMSSSVVTDISEKVELTADRQKAEVALYRSHQRIITILESITDAYTAFDVDWHIIYTNPLSTQMLCQLTGLEPTELLGKNHWEIFPWTIGTIVEQEYRRAVAEQNPAHFEVLYEPSGDWFEIHAYPSAEGIGVYFRNITERKRSQQSLQTSESKYRTFFNSIDEGFVLCNVIFDAHSRPIDIFYVEANAAADRMTGQKLAGKYTSQISPDFEAHWFEILGRVTQTGEAVRRELSAAPLNAWYEVYAFSVNPDQHQIALIYKDITDRKIAEQRMIEQAHLLDITTDAMFVHDLEHHIVFWNQGAEDLYGWKTAEIIDQDWRQLIKQVDDSEAASEAKSILQSVLVTGEWRGEIEKVTKEERAVVVMSRHSLMLDATGKPKSILVVDTDITEKKQLETQFLRTQRLESLGTLASGIAHDLNNILTPIIGIAQLLPMRLPNLDPKSQRLLQILDHSSHRGADLVKQILAFTRGVEGKPANTQVRSLLTEIKQIIRQTFPKNIELCLDLPQDLWLIVSDATLLHQVFMNLCVNSRDAMPNGGLLSITAENLEIDKAYARMHLDAQVGFYVVVKISDTGMGIPPEAIDRIFDPFFTTKEVGKGTGLGLSTVIGIIKSHHGFVNVYSEVGKGTQFKVYLPAVTSSEVEIIPNKAQPLGKGELILVVDDEIPVQEITQATLEDHGYRVIVANDGIEAIAIYAERKAEISVVMVDMMMPTLDSVTTIRTLSKLNPRIKIIAMSGLASNESEAKNINKSVAGFLAKPFSTDALLHLIAPLCADLR